MEKYKTACAIIINNKNEILLTKRARKPFLGYWALPSGIGESKKGTPSELGVVEEVRCDLGTGSFKGKLLFSLLIENDEMTDEAVVFVGRINEEELVPESRFSAGYKWVPEKNTEEFKNLAFEHSQILEKYLKGK